MGCDGGSIPKRKEVVKSRKKKQKVDPEIEYINKWGYCCVSDNVLKKPVVATAMGSLMTKEGAIEFLLNYREGLMMAYHKKEDIPGLKTFNTMKDMKELNLKEIDKSNTEAASTSAGTGDVKWADYCCPITGLEMNGHHKFVFSWQCGCVVSERAFKEVVTEKKCLVCREEYKDFDIVILNPDKKDFKKNEENLMIRKAHQMLLKHGLVPPFTSGRTFEARSKRPKPSSSGPQPSTLGASSSST